MAKTRETSNKKSIRDEKVKKKKEKERKKLERKENHKDGGASFDDMIAYVDENGMLTSTPPDITKRKKVIAADIEISIPKSEDLEPEEKIRNGIVAFFNESKGYGFIKDLANQQSVFVHINNVSEPLKENNKVTFEIEFRDKGPVAVNVKIDRG